MTRRTERSTGLQSPFLRNANVRSNVHTKTIQVFYIIIFYTASLGY